jgi:hypothetical protein
MKKIAFATLVSAGLALAACGSSDSADEPAMADNVEMPAEEAVVDVDPAATPAADPSATATTAPDATATDAAAGAAPAASPAASAAATAPAKQ